jgi:hypothetical protein
MFGMTEIGSELDAIRDWSSAGTLRDDSTT